MLVRLNCSCNVVVPENNNIFETNKFGSYALSYAKCNDEIFTFARINSSNVMMVSTKRITLIITMTKTAQSIQQQILVRWIYDNRQIEFGFLVFAYLSTIIIFILNHNRITS